MTKIAGSGSGSTSQRHGSADPDPDEDPHQNCHGSARLEPADLDGMRVLQSVQLQGDDEHVAAELLPHLELGMDPIVIVFFRVVDPK
jgi:hypothetical protein